MTAVVTSATEAPRTTDHDGHILAAARGTGFLALGSFFEFASRFLIALMLARILGANDYGLYVLSVSAATIFAGLSGMGLDDAMVRYVAILSGRRDQPGVLGTIRIGLGVSSVAGVVMGALLFVAARPLALHVFDEPRLTDMLQLLAFVVPFLTVSNVLAGVSRGFGRMDYAALAENVVQSLVRLVLLALVAVSVQGLSVSAAVIIFGVSDVAATLTFALLLHRYLPSRRLREQDVRCDVREVFGFALPLWMSGLLRQLRRNFETIMLGASRNLGSVGIYSIVNKVTLVGHVCLLSLFLAVKPTLARLHDRRDHAALAHLYTTATRWAFSVTLPFFLVMVLYREPILSVFGASFAAGSTALVILAFAELVNAGTGICGPVLDMTGHTRIKLLNSIVLTVLLVGSNAILIPRYGVIGAATASLIGIGIFNVLCLVEVWFLERLTPFDRTMWKPAAAALVAFGGGTLLGHWFPPGTSAVLAASQAVVVTAMFAGLLVALGLPDDDRLVVRRAAAKAWAWCHGRRGGRGAGPGPVTATLRASTDAMGTQPPPSTVARGPIYVGGLDRSGKTTLAAFLTSHPNIAVPDVGSNMWTYFYGQYGDIAKPANFERCFDAMLRYKHVLDLDPDTAWVRREFLSGPPTYARLFALFLDDYARRHGKSRWGVQTGLIERYADLLFAADHDAKVIHMVRDPRDRYEGSLTLWPDGRGRAGGATARWTYSMRLARRHVRKYPGRYLVVRYEDLVRDTEPTLRAVCAFLGEDYASEMLWMPGATERRDRLVRRAEHCSSEGPLSEEFIGRFRDGVPPDELAFIQLHARRLMRRHGYATVPPQLSRAEWGRFIALGWANQAARMMAWRGVEAVQQRLPAYVGRKPDARTIVERPAGSAR